MLKETVFRFFSKRKIFYWLKCKTQILNLLMQTPEYGHIKTINNGKFMKTTSL